jgi:hypothetical protein
MLNVNDRVQPRFYTKAGYDRGTVTEVVNGRLMWVKWDNHPKALLERVSDLDKLH